MPSSSIARVYDLILNEQTSEEERSILVEFKNAVESGKRFSIRNNEISRDFKTIST